MSHTITFIFKSEDHIEQFYDLLIDLFLAEDSDLEETAMELCCVLLDGDPQVIKSCGDWPANKQEV